MTDPTPAHFDVPLGHYLRDALRAAELPPVVGHSCDAVLCVHRAHDDPSVSSEEARTVEVHVEKNRFGPRHRVTLGRGERRGVVLARRLAEPENAGR